MKLKLYLEEESIHLNEGEDVKEYIIRKIREEKLSLEIILGIEQTR